MRNFMKYTILIGVAMLIVLLGINGMADQNLGFNLSIQGDNINVTHTEELLGGATYTLVFASEDKMNDFLEGIHVNVPVKWNQPTLLIGIPPEFQGTTKYATLWVTSEDKVFRVAQVWLRD